MALVEMVLDGTPMMVPEEDCHLIKKNGELHKIFTLGGGYTLMEFEGLEGTFEEQLQIVKNNRAEALKPMKGIIYKATNKKTGKSYIGQTIKTLDRRKQQHFFDVSNGSDFYFHKALRKYGNNNFDWEIIESIEYEDKKKFIDILNYKEQYFIKKFDLFENGYNLTTGGDGISGYHHSAKTKLKMSEAHQNIIPWIKGKKHTKETKKKMGQAQKGRKHSDETKKKISASTKERFKNSKEHPWYGKHRTEETKKKISETVKAKNSKPANFDWLFDN